eukprot:114592_1
MGGSKNRYLKYAFAVAIAAGLIKYRIQVKSLSKQNWKYALAFTCGSFASFIASFAIFKNLTGYNIKDLIFTTMIKYNASKYRNALKYENFSIQPKIRPSSESMAVDAIFRNAPKAPKNAPRETFVDPKSKWYWKKMRETVNSNNVYRIPKFMQLPSKMTVSENWNGTNFELNGYFYEYTDCSIDNGIILYIHGGGFFLSSHNEIDTTLCIIMQYTEYPVFSLEYQLLPEADGIPNIVNQCIDTYKFILNTLKVMNHKIFIMGASAGGSLALLTLQKIRDLKLPNPLGGILISPIGDNTGQTMYDCQQKDGINDCMLSPVNLNLSGYFHVSKADREKYNNDENAICRLPNYSPLFADFKGVCPIYLSASLNEVLINDSKGILKKCQEANVDIEYRWDQVLPHVTMCFATFIPEARDSLIIMIQWMKKQMRKSEREV